MKVCPICRSRHEDSISCAQHELTTEDTQVTPPDLIPGFRLVSLLESGQFSELHRAVESASGRSCLIRIIATDDSGSRQLLSEAKLAGGIFHPSIAGFYQAGQLDDGSCFLVSEELEGRSLRDVLDNNGTPELLDTIEIVRLTAEALHALHVEGLIHGAVNPSNIIVSPGVSGSGMVHVQHPDLGHVRQRSIISNRFLIDKELDSLRYFSPEQCDGEVPSIPTDVYALGLVFYEMIAGFPPFEASTAVALIHQHKNQPPPDIRIENFNLRMLVTHALTEALQKQSRLRQSSANLFARQLRHIEQLATHTSTPPPAGTVSHIPPAAITPVVQNTAPIRKVHTAEVMPSMWGAPVDVRQQHPESTLTPEVINEHKAVEIEQIVDTPVIAHAGEMRGRVISVEEALAEDRATLTNLEVPRPHRPSPLQALKDKLHAVTSLLSFERVHPDETQLEGAIQGTDSLDEDSMMADAPRMPKKIEWVQPEDDIPSIDAIQEVLARDLEMPLSIPTFEPEPEPAIAFAAETDTERIVPAKIEWVQPDDDIPSINAVQEVLAMEQEILRPIPAPDPEIEPIYASAPEPEITLPWESEPQVINVEAESPAPEIIAAEVAPSEPQELIVEPPSPEPVIIQVEPETSEPEIIHAETAVPAPEEFIVAPAAIATRKLRRKPSRRKRVKIVAQPLPVEPHIIQLDAAEAQELVVERAKLDAEVIHVESAEPQELVVEPAQLEAEVIHVESAEPQELVVEPAQSEQEVIQFESAAFESEEAVDEPQQSEPAVIEVEPLPPAPEIVVASTSPSGSLKGVLALKEFAAAAVQKRRKKKSSPKRRVEPLVEPLQLAPEVIQSVSEPQELVVEPPQRKPDPVHVESPAHEEEKLVASTDSEPQQIIVEPAQSEPEVVQLEPAVSETQEIIVEPAQPEPEIIQVERATSEAQVIIDEPQLSEPEVIHVEPAAPQEVIVEPQASEPEAIQAVTETREPIVEQSQSEPEIVHAETTASEPQELVVEPRQPEPENIHAEPAAPTAESGAAQSLTSTTPAVAQAFPAILRRHKKSSQRRPIVITKPVSADDEEITVVRARSKRVRVHVDPRPAPQRSQPAIRRRTPAPAEFAFVPTLLGAEVESTDYSSEQDGTMFAAYSSESFRPISRYRSHLIGGGIIALLALALFGNDSITDFFQLSSDDSMTAEATRRYETKSVVPSTTKPIDKPIIDKPVVDKRVVDKKERTIVKTKAPVSSSAGTSIPHESLMKIMIPIPSRGGTVAAKLTTDNAVPKRTVSPKMDSTTRPRVVKDPNR